MTNIKIYNSRPMHFCASSYSFGNVNVSNWWPYKSRSSARSTISQSHHSMANAKIYKRLPHFCCASSPSFRDINIKINYLQNVGQSRLVQFSQWRYSIASIKILQTSFFIFFIFVKVGSVRTKVTHGHRSGQAYRYWRNLAVLPKN